jgi:ADP-heptose:LPS heptosyltransferase
LEKVYFLDRSSITSYLRQFLLLKHKYDYIFSFFPGRMNTFCAELLKADNKYYYRNYKRLPFWHESSQAVFKNGKKTDAEWHPADNYIRRVELVLNFLIDNPRVEKPVFPGIELNEALYGNYIVINNSSRDKRRQFTRKLEEDIVKYCIKSNVGVYILEFGKSLPYDKFLNEFRVKDLKFDSVLNLILRSRLFISADSFLIHIADAYGVNSLGIFGPTKPESVLLNHSFRTIAKNPVSSVTIDDIINYLGF